MTEEPENTDHEDEVITLERAQRILAEAPIWQSRYRAVIAALAARLLGTNDGLVLVTADDVQRVHGVRVRIESEPGSGITIHLTRPDREKGQVL